MATIAGHTFVDTPMGRMCSCGRRFVDICGTTKADRGKPNIAHHGNVNDTEIDEIDAENSRIWDALCGVASSKGA